MNAHHLNLHDSFAKGEADWKKFAGEVDSAIENKAKDIQKTFQAATKNISMKGLALSTGVGIVGFIGLTIFGLPERKETQQIDIATLFSPPQTVSKTPDPLPSIQQSPKLKRAEPTEAAPVAARNTRPTVLTPATAVREFRVNKDIPVYSSSLGEPQSFLGTLVRGSCVTSTRSDAMGNLAKISFTMQAGLLSNEINEIDNAFVPGSTIALKVKKSEPCEAHFLPNLRL